MYLARVEARGFRSLRDTEIELRPSVTVMVGENNGGKTNVIDAVLLLTDPLEEGRSRRWWAAGDVSISHEGPVTLTAVYHDLSAAEIGTHVEALVQDPDAADGASRRATYTVSYTPPPLKRLSGTRELYS